MKKFIKKHQLLTFAVILTCILAITHFAFGYPKSGWGIAAPAICAAIIEGVAWLLLLNGKNVRQTQVSGDNSKLVQYSSDKKAYQYQDGGEGCEQVQIHGEE